MNLRNIFRFIALACACLCGAVASAQVTRFVVTEAGGNSAVGTTPIKAGTSINLRVTAVDAGGNAVADYAQQVTLAFAELRRPSSGPWGASSGWAQVAIPASAFVGGVADNVAITVKHAGTGDRRIIVTDGNIATYDAAGLFSVAPASYQVTLSGNNYALGSIPHLLGRSIPVRVRALNSDGSVAEGFQGPVTLSSNAGTPTFSPVVAQISSHGVVDGVPLTPTILATGDTVNASDVSSGGMTTTAAASSTFNVVSTSSGNGLAGERLQISNVQVSNSVTPGGPANVSFTATNPGVGEENPPIPVPGPIDFLIEAYNSDGLLVASSVIQRPGGVGGGAQDTSVSISGTLYMPDTSAGTFNIMVHAGLNGNVGQGPLTIDKLSDLSITRFDYTPGEYRGGDAVRFDLVWTNLETAPTPNIAYLAEIRLSANDTYGDEDDFLVWSNRNRAQGAPEVLRTGQSQVVSDEFLLPKNIPGSYYLIAKVNGVGGRVDSALAFAEVTTSTNVTSGGLEAAKITLLPIQASETTRVSLTTAGAQTAGIAAVSDRPVISQNGRYVAFHSYAPLDPTVTTSNIANVFFRDTLLNLTTLVSLSSFNGAANGSSMYPRMSADGRYVVYQSAATNLLPSDTNGYTDIFITDLSGASSVRTRRILPSETTQANQGAFLPDISADGRFIVFESTSTNLVSGVNTGVKQIFLYDRDVSGSGTFDSVGNTRVTLVSKTAANVVGTAASTSPRISRDGAYVVFTTRAPNLIAPGSSPFAQIVRWERATGALVTVSRSAGNVLADGEAGFPVINADGSYVVYASRAKNLTADPTVTGVPHLFRARVVAGSVTEVVRINGAGGVELNNPSTGSFAPDLGSLEPAISDDGSIVAFTSESTNVLPTIPVRHIDRTEYLSGTPQHYLDDNAASDVYVANLADPLSPLNMRVSVSSFGFAGSPGTPTPQNRAPAMSGDSRYIVFTSDAKGMSGLVFGASNLDPVATNSAKDVYIFDAKSGLAPAPTDQPAVILTLDAALTVPSNTILSLTAEITNASRQIAQVEFYADGLLVATATAPSVVNGTAYASNWDLSTLGLLATKTYEVAAIAVDVGGLRSPMSNASEVTVRPIVGLVPIVSITAPSGSSATTTTTSSINFTASAYDSDGAVQSVEFFANGYSLGQAVRLGTTSTWRLVNDFSLLGAGTYAITAVATDDDDNRSSSAPLNLVVTGALSAAPTISLTANATSVATGQDITLFAATSDPDGTVTSVHYYANGALIDTRITAPFTGLWKPSVAGSYQLEAIATDNSGNTTVSNSLAVAVGSNSSPVATLIVPTMTVTTGSPLPLGVLAGDIDGTIINVTFYANGATIDSGSDLSASWTPTLPGSYRLVARVEDDSGNVVFTPEVMVTVNPESGQRPVASLNLRAANSEFPPKYTQGSSVVISAVASDQDGSIASVILSVNGRTLVSRTAPPFTATYTFKSTDVGYVNFAAIVQDNDGNIQVASADALVYSLSKEVPVIQLTAPTGDATLTAGTSIIVSADVRPIDAELESVQILRNGRLIATLDAPPYTTTLTLDEVGTTELRAVTYYESPFYRLQPNPDGSTTRVDFDIATSAVSASRTITVGAATGALPSVSIASPQANATLTAASTLNLTATAFDSDGSITSVEFLVNGGSVGQGTPTTGSASWRLPFSFATRGAGSYTLTALATDSSGNRVLSAPVTVTVVGATSLPPAVSLSASALQVITGQEVTFSASAADNDGRVVRVQFFANGMEIANLTASPFTANWTPTGAGTYDIFAIATDDTGNSTVSSSLTVTVTLNQLPVVAITSPVDGGFVSTGREVTIFATASDADGNVTKVEFFANGASIGSVSSSPYRINWTPGIPGDYALSVVATDNRGGVSSTSAAVNVFAAFEVRFSPLIDAGEFVNAVYADLLDRTPTTAEFDATVARFSAIVPLTRPELVTELENTPEFRVRLQQITAYKIVMGEWPTRDELQAAIDAAGGGTGGGSAGDDHGDTASTATTVNSSVTSGRIETWGDIDFFRINVTTAGTFTFSTSGSSDTVGTLYDSAGNVIAENDDAGSGWNFLITRSLTAGTYYVSVEGWMGFVTGSYRLNVTGPGFSNNGGPVEGTDLALTTFINNLFSSSVYLAKYGSVPSLNTAASRVALFTQLFVNNYAKQPTDQQKLEGSTNLNALGSAATYVSYMATGTKISGRDLIYNAPDVSKQHLSAALILGLQRIRPVAADVLPLAALTPLNAAEVVLDDADYVNRYITVDNPPLSQTVAGGDTLRLSVDARGSQPFSFQWYRNGSPLAGAISQFLTINNVTTANAGLYSVEITSPKGAVFSQPALVTVGTNTSRIVNLSTRAQVGSEEQTMIAGFMVSGSEPRQMLIRAAGPALKAYGVDGVLANPHLSLYKEKTLIATNDDWSADVDQAGLIAETGSRLNAFTFNNGSSDAALLVTLEPGTYTTHVTGAGGGTGVSLVEVYDAGTTLATQATNVSTRAAVQSGGDNIVIAGFIIKGTSPRKVLVRAVGPSLVSYDVRDFLGNPRLTIHRQSDGAVLYRNDDWAASTDAAAIVALGDQVGAFPLLAGSKDAAMIVTLAPGEYTAQATSEDGGTGVVLIEVYDLEN